MPHPLVRSPLTRLLAAVGLLAALTACPATPPAQLSIASPGSAASGSTVTLQASGDACAAPTWTASAGTLDATTGATVKLTLPAASMSEQLVSVTATCGSFVTTTSVKVPAQTPTLSLNSGARITALSAGLNLDLSASASFGCQPADLKWTATSGSLSSDHGAQVTYTAPTTTLDGSATIGVTCGTGEHAATQTFTVPVHGTSSRPALDLYTPAGVFSGDSIYPSLIITPDVPCTDPQVSVTLGQIRDESLNPTHVTAFRPSGRPYLYTPPTPADQDRTVTMSARCGAVSLTRTLTVFGKPALDVVQAADNGVSVDAGTGLDLDFNQSVQLQGRPTDKPGLCQNYVWTVDDGSNPQYGNSFSWTAPVLTQDRTFTLTVSCGGTTVTRTLNVKAAPELGVVASATTVEGSQSIVVTATSPIGVPVVWSATPAAGSFMPLLMPPPIMTTNQAVWTAPPATSQDQVITIRAEANGLSGTKVITVRAAPVAPAIAETPARVDGGTVVPLSATARPGDAIGWSANPNAGLFDTASDGSVTWTAPAATSHEQPVTLAATASGLQATRSIVVNASNPSVSVTADPTSVDGNGPVQLTATTGPGCDLADLTWSAQPDAGAFTNRDGGSITWTAPAAGEAAQPVTFTATCGQGSGQATISLKAAPTTARVTVELHGGGDMLGILPENVTLDDGNGRSYPLAFDTAAWPNPTNVFASGSVEVPAGQYTLTAGRVSASNGQAYDPYQTLQPVSVTAGQDQTAGIGYNPAGSLQVNLHGPAELAGQIPESVVLDGNGQPVASPAFQPEFAYDPGSQEFNTGTVPNLAAGPHTVSFGNLTVNGVTYAPNAASLPVSVANGESTPVDVTYTATTGTVTIDFFGPEAMAGALPQNVYLGTPDAGGPATFTGPQAYDLGNGVFYEYTITGASLGTYTVNPSGFGFDGTYYQSMEGMVQQSLSGGQSLNFQVHYEPTAP